MTVQELIFALEAHPRRAEVELKPYGLRVGQTDILMAEPESVEVLNGAGLPLFKVDL